MHFIKGNFKFMLILFLLFFGGGIMAVIDGFDFTENKTGIIYQENDNIVLSEVNKIHNQPINYDLEESYIHYLPVKKTGFLDSFNKGKNLAIPDLTGKEYLGNGVYRLFDNYGLTIDYNIYNGYHIVNGEATVNITQYYIDEITMGLEQGLSYYVKYYYISGTSNTTLNEINYRTYTTPLLIGLNNTNGDSFLVDYEPSLIAGLRFDFKADNIYDNLTFRVQVEQGDTSTPYTVPYIPALKIDFQGSNQVEYINPFQEQVIKINDINNVSNIKFDLLNTKHNIIYNWNIKTNENLPFLRYYNEENRLVYDFTDIDEMNSIGNTIMVNTTGFTNIIEGVLGMVDMFYTGFQKIFTVDNVETIREAIKIKIPVPIFPWIGN